MQTHQSKILFERLLLMQKRLAMPSASSAGTAPLRLPTAGHTLALSGAMKDFLDRTFYEVEGKIQPLPYSVFISAGNDGSGALRAIRRIANGYPFKEVQEPVVVVGDATLDDLGRCKELGMALAAGIDADIF